MALIRDVKLSEQVLKDYMCYGMSTIVDRALPKVEDGFLPVQRKILYSMNVAKMTSDKEFAKCLDIIGNATKYYVHGDSSLMGALSLLVDTNQTQITPFIMGHGNFGNTLTKGGYSAPRYTFAKLSNFSEKTLFEGIKDGVVDMIGDEEHKEPIYLPTMYPNILTVYSKAIAVGEACDFNGFNLIDICDYTSKYIKDRSLIASDYIIPDFPTSCQIIYNKDNIKNICDNGKGSIKLRGNYNFDKDNNILTMYVPYSTTVEKVLKEVISKINSFKEITDVKDGSGFNKKEQKEEYCVDIYVKKNIDIDSLVRKLYKNTSLESNVSYNMNCLINFVPKVRGINEILDYWIEFREGCIIKLLNKEIETKSNTLHIMLGLKKVLVDVDKAIKIIRNCKEEEIIKQLSDEFFIDEKQSQFIADMKLRNINSSYIKKQIKQIDDLQKDVEYLNFVISNKDEIDKIIISQLEDVKKKFGKPRKTEIIQESEIQTIKQEDLIEDFTTTLVFTEQQYFKKCRRYSEDQNIKDGDTIKTIIQDSNKSKVLFFSNQGNIYIKNIWELNENKPSNLGQYLPNLLPLETNETIIGMISTNNYKGDSLIMYPDGHLALINLEKGYYTKQNSTKLKNGLSKKMDLPIYIGQITDDVEIELTDVFGKTKTISTKDINRKDSRNSQGVTAWNSKKKDWKLTSATLLK